MLSAPEFQWQRRNPKNSVLIEFLAVEIAGEPRCLEHQALAWMEERDLLALPLAPSDRRYVEFRLNGRPPEDD